MALPSYASPVQKTYYYAYLFFCGVVFFFLVAPLIAIVPISFSVSPFMVFTDECLLGRQILKHGLLDGIKI